jgi:hypothetical protein
MGLKRVVDWPEEDCLLIRSLSVLSESGILIKKSLKGCLAISCPSLAHPMKSQEKKLLQENPVENCC